MFERSRWARSKYENARPLGNVVRPECHLSRAHYVWSAAGCGLVPRALLAGPVTRAAAGGGRGRRRRGNAYDNMI